MKPLVSVCMITYNHEEFIAEAIESIIAQKTHFEFELVIGVDFSSDSTRALALAFKNKYSEKIKLLLHDCNIGMSDNFSKTFFACNGEYIALCEGDDYWTDPFKLQKQIDFLQSTAKATICWTRYQILDSNKKLYANDREDSYFKNSAVYRVDLTNLFEPYLTLTVTAVFRRSVLDEGYLNKFHYFKDNTLYALALSKGEGYVLDEFTAVYRIHENGVFSSISREEQLLRNINNIKEIYNKIPGAKNLHIKKILFYHITEAQDYYNLDYKELQDFRHSNINKVLLVYVHIKDRVEAFKNYIKKIIKV
jgi:glycosyltransferase involved in cell wall biosynthesis